MSTTDRNQRLEELALELEGADRPDESYLDAVNRIRGAWTTAREMLGEEAAGLRNILMLVLGTALVVAAGRQWMAGGLVPYGPALVFGTLGAAALG